MEQVEALQPDQIQILDLSPTSCIDFGKLLQIPETQLSYIKIVSNTPSWDC